MLPVLFSSLENHGFSSSAIATTASNYKKKHGKHPDWYINKGYGQTYVDIGEINRLRSFNKRAWVYSTDDLFFMLTYHLGINEHKLAQILTKRSLEYKSASSWIRFFAVSLFMTPITQPQTREYSMIYDFCLLGTKLVNEYIRFMDQVKLDKCSDEMKEVLRQRGTRPS